MYRALGFQIVDGIFADDHIAFVQGDDPWAFKDKDAARETFFSSCLPSLRRLNRQSEHQFEVISSMEFADRCLGFPVQFVGKIDPKEAGN